jgi:hypothetical protein
MGKKSLVEISDGRMDLFFLGGNAALLVQAHNGLMR